MFSTKINVILNSKITHKKTSRKALQPIVHKCQSRRMPRLIKTSTTKGSKKSLRESTAWDATIRNEGFSGGANGGRASLNSPYKRKATTRAMKNESTASTTHKRQNVHGGLSELAFKRQSRLERLELTNCWDPLERSDLLNARSMEDDSDDDMHSKRKKRSSANYSNKKQLFLADVLLQEGATSEFVRTQARPSMRPIPERICDVTGKVAKYCDPVTGLNVADRKAIALLKEQVPSWLKATAISPYWDAISSLKAED